MPKKPQGYNAVMSVSGEGVTLKTFEMPSDKRAAERLIVEVFLSSLTKVEDPPLTILSYRQNEENDLDFTINTPGGVRQLELTELAPQAWLKRGGFSNAPNTFSVGELADHLSECVYGKNRYGTAGHKVLLVYSTHYGFMISDNVLLLVRSKLATTPHGFETVIFFAPIEADFGFVTPLFPVPVVRLSASQRSAIRANVLTNFDPRSATCIKGSGVAFGSPSK